jgi:hypothetical protein
MSLLPYHLGLSERNVRECVAVLMKYDAEMGEIFARIYDMSIDITRLIVQEMIDLDADRLYWKGLIDSTPWHITMTRWNAVVYHILGRILSNLHPSCWLQERGIINQIMPQIRDGSLFEPLEFPYDKTDVDHVLLVINSMQREFACNLSSVHYISYRLRAIYREILQTELSYYTLMKAQNMRSSSMKSIKSIDSPMRDIREGTNQELFAKIKSILKANLCSLIDILCRLNGSDFDSLQSTDFAQNMSYLNSMQNPGVDSLKRLQVSSRTLYNEMMRYSAMNQVIIFIFFCALATTH